MRILHLIPNLSGGGAERQLSYLARESARKGHEVHIGALHPGPDPDYECPAGVAVHFLPHSSNYDPRILFRLIRLIREIKPDLLQTWILQMDILGGLVAVVSRIPWILREPAGSLHYGNGWKSWLRIRIGSHSRAVVANSSWGIQYWQSRCPAVWHRIIPNGFPLDEIAAVPVSRPGEWGIGPERKYIICAGRLAEQKNLINLIKAFSLVSNEKEVLLFICGEGPLRNSLIRMARKSGIGDNVRVSGFVPSSRLWSLMKGAELLVLVSGYEGFPNVIAEAMICGCPLVVSDIPAHREFLDDALAVFADPRDPRKIAEAILDSLGDPEGARRRARNAREKAQMFSVEAMAAGFDDLYREAVSRACPDPRRKRS